MLFFFFPDMPPPAVCDYLLSLPVAEAEITPEGWLDA